LSDACHSPAQLRIREAVANLRSGDVRHDDLRSGNESTASSVGGSPRGSFTGGLSRADSGVSVDAASPAMVTIAEIAPPAMSRQRSAALDVADVEVKRLRRCDEMVRWRWRGALSHDGGRLTCGDSLRL
jgi:hypothetical protein